MTTKSPSLASMQIEERLDFDESLAALRVLREKSDLGRNFFPALNGNEVHALVNIAVALWVKKHGGKA